MSGTETVLLHLDPALVDVPEDRLRDVDPVKVSEFAASMRQVGQLTPIEVYAGPTPGRYTLIAGANRLAAAKEAPLASIMAIPFEGTADQRRLREIDENLFRYELNPYDQAAFLAERRRIFERLNGPVRAGRRKQTGNSDNLSQLTFFDDVTSKFGLPRRMVERALRRQASISAEVWHRLRGHPLSKIATELDKLARLNEAEQRRVVRLLTQDVHPAKNVSAAVRALSDEPIESVDAKQFRRLCEAWSKAGAKARGDFRAYLDRGGPI